MRRSALFASFTAAAFVLASCGSSNADADGDGEISLEEAAAKSDEMIRPEPGEYRATVEMTDQQMPGAPPEAQDMMRAMMGSGEQVSTFCLTREQAERGFEEMLRQTQDEGECSFEKFEAEGGSIDAVMTCRGSERGNARIAMEGSGTSTSSNMTMTMDAEGPGGQSMTMTMQSRQERIGDCEG